MSGAFGRLAKSVLSRLGQDALLVSGGTSKAVRVNIEFGVQMQGPYDDAVFERDIATLAVSDGARAGDKLVAPSGSFVLDGKMSDNGYLQRFTVQKVLTP